MTEVLMQDQPQLNRPDHSEQWDIGTSATCAEVLTHGEGMLLVGLFGPAPLARATSPRARLLVQRCWEAHFESELDSATAGTLREAAAMADDALRARYTPADPDGRGSAILALFDKRGVELAGTLGAVAYLVRRRKIAASWEAGLSQHTGSAATPHEFLGGRPSDSSDVVVDTLADPWQLEPQDRVVLATRDLRAWLQDGQLAELASGGALEFAAQTLAEITNLRGSGMEVGTAIVEWSRSSAAEHLHADDEWSDVLETLEDLVPQLTDPGGDEEPEAPAYDDDDATAGFAPIREREHARGDAVLSLTPAWAPDPSEPDELRAADAEPNAPAATPQPPSRGETPVAPDPPPARSRLPAVVAAGALFTLLALATAWLAMAAQ